MGLRFHIFIDIVWDADWNRGAAHHLIATGGSVMGLTAALLQASTTATATAVFETNKGVGCFWDKQFCLSENIN